MGPVEVRTFCDGEGLFPLPLHDAFHIHGSGRRLTRPEWARYRARHPGVFDHSGERWFLHVRCFVVRTPDATIVVDTGLGRTPAPGARWLGVEGRLPDAMAEAGIDPASVDVVVLTHLHLDHAGWTVRRDEAGPRPTFPRARYLVHRDDLTRPEDDDHRWSIAPLERAEVLEPVTGEMELAAGIRLVPTPGHTPGSQTVLVDTGEGTIALWGDVANHPAQIEDPAICSAGDHEPARTVATREDVLARAVDQRWLIGSSHFAEPFGRVTAADGARAWRATRDAEG